VQLTDDDECDKSTNSFALLYLRIRLPASQQAVNTIDQYLVQKTILVK
jgi:hypothetical protein